MIMYKRSKMGCLPGDYSKKVKIAMLEKRDTIVGANCAKSYRKDFCKIANRRFRRKPVEAENV